VASKNFRKILSNVLLLGEEISPHVFPILSPNPYLLEIQKKSQKGKGFVNDGRCSRIIYERFVTSIHDSVMYAAMSLVLADVFLLSSKYSYLNY